MTSTDLLTKATESKNSNTNNNNGNSSIESTSTKLSRNVQRLALNNVTNKTLQQENSLNQSSNLQNLKSSLLTTKNNTITSTSNKTLNRTNIQENINDLSNDSNKNNFNDQLINNNNNNNTNNNNNNDKHSAFIEDKENNDPYQRTNLLLTNSDQNDPEQANKEHLIKSNDVENVAPITQQTLDIPENKFDDNKKRPISTVVEQEEPKKFKVCDENGEEEYVWEDLDAEDVNDPFMVSEYVNDVFGYLHHLEVVTLPRKEDLFKHRNIRQNRDILVNWLVKIHNKFGLLPETLYLAINIMDRFLCKELVQLDKLQLVGTSCLFIASKYEEVYSPSIKHYASETDGACTEDEIKEGEKFILKTLEFNLNYPNPMNFLRRISKADDYDIQSRTLAKFLLEISLVDFRFIGVLPSLCAAAAMFLSRKMLGKGKWDGNLIHYSGGYTKTQLAPVCHMIMDYLTSPIVHDEFHRKYQSRRFMKASVISVQWALKVRKNGYDIMTLHEIT